MTRTASRLMFFTTLLFSNVALAQINVDYLSGSNWINLSQLPAGSHVSINDAAGSTYRVYTLTPATQSIGNLTITSSGTNAPTLFVGRGRNVPSEAVPLPTVGAYDIGSVSYSGGQPKLQMRVGHNITGDVTFWQICRIDAGLNILANITHDPVNATPPPPLGNITAHSIGSSDTRYYITAKRGDIGAIAATLDIFSDIQCDNGSITGRIQAGFPGSQGFIASSSITALNGSINDVISYGQIGTGPPAYTTKVQIRAHSGIHLVQSNNTMRADIVANACGGSGDIARVEVLSSEASEPHFHGTITANSGTGEAGGFYPIACEGDFFGIVTLESDLERGIYVGGQFHAASLISIGGSILPGTFIDIGSIGGNPCFQGQIIVNANNNGSSWSAASSAAFCGESPSVLPWYDNIPSTFGGGAIGQVPYNFHAASCTPPHHSATAGSVFPAVVVVRHYGPVFTQGDAPLQVYARQSGTLAWTEYTADYTYAVSTNNNRRNISISRKATGLGWVAGHDYRVVPVTSLADRNHNTLRCLDATSKPAVRSYEYTFNITN
ncbi:MAG: hypothetical protein H7210_06965 [Pyrinomonadaceae bacterium]|nr:hypothetical protein [Phycisphaerales bacterium]